jgi:hypothetical protein
MDKNVAESLWLWNIVDYWLQNSTLWSFTCKMKHPLILSIFFWMVTQTKGQLVEHTYGSLLHFLQG